LSKDYGYGKTNLLTVLNAYVQDNGGEPPGLWSAGPDGYPIPCTIQWP
jgi:hypothetical protein